MGTTKPGRVACRAILAVSITVGSFIDHPNNDAQPASTAKQQTTAQYFVTASANPPDSSLLEIPCTLFA
jgi:hypothetical protein